MKFVSFVTDGAASWGLLEGGEVVDLGHSMGLHEALADPGSVRVAGARRRRVEEVSWLPAVPAPGKVLCIGVNYVLHREETGRKPVAHPTVFTRFASSLVGHEGAMVRPRVSTSLDFEGELAVVIGRAGRYVAREDAWGHVAGFACFNDGSVRDWQRHTSQFTPGKNFPATGGFGPWVVTADEVGEIGALRIETRIGDRVVQEARLGEMLFDVPALIEYCSGFCELRPGDVIATGTPGGVGERREPQLWLQPGDVVEVEIERVGVLRNVVVAEG